LSFEGTPPTISKVIPKAPEVSEPQPEEKSKQPEEPTPEVLAAEKKEEALKQEELVKKEEVNKEVMEKDEIIKKEGVIEKEGVIKKENWVVHVASVRTRELAMVQKEQLMAAGFPAYSVPAKVRGEDWIRVRVGFFNSRGEAQKAGEQIERKFIAKGPYWITKISKKEMEDLLGK